MDDLVGTAIWMFLTLTGRLLIPVLSFGRWRGEPLTGDEGRVFSAAGSLWFRREGRVVLTHTGQLFVGLAFYSLVAVAASWALL